jgi:uncharacterized protein (DUF433 family)
MPTQRHGIVSGDDSEIHDEPHIAGSRITVHYIQQRVEERGLQPETVADRHDLDLADVYAALAYYHNHPEEMRAVKQRREEAGQRAQESSSVTPGDVADGL